MKTPKNQYTFDFTYYTSLFLKVGNGLSVILIYTLFFEYFL